jgi:hypothetical protein
LELAQELDSEISLLLDLKLKLKPEQNIPEHMVKIDFKSEKLILKKKT